MRDIKGLQDSEYSSYTYLEGGYEELIHSFEYEVVCEQHDEGYSGDSFYLLKDGNRYGICRFGWGSCSGCDALHACTTRKDFYDLRDSLHNDIIWYESKEALLLYIHTKDWSTEWNPQTHKTFINKITEVLMK